MNLSRHYARQAEKEFSPGTRLMAMAGESLIFVFGIPATLFWLAAKGGEHWRFNLSPALAVVCVGLAALGLGFALWTVWAQFRHARGTPVPVMATKKLLTDKPYSFCRNPMALGTFVFYFGIAAFTASFTAILAVLAFAICLVVYIKLVEEKEMAVRFGDDYTCYKQRTPFLIPRFRKPETATAQTKA